MSGIPNRADSAAAREPRSSAGPSRNGVGTGLSSLVRTRPDVVGASRRIPWLSGRRWLLFSLVLGTSGLGTSLMLRIVGSGGIHALEVAIILLFACTFGWTSVAFWTGLFGFGLQLFRRDPLTLARIRSPAPLGRPEQRTEEPLASRTAIVMPVCNEDSARVIGGLRAVIRSVARTGQGDGFDAFLLSDSTDPEISREEEVVWKRWMERSVPGFGRCVYRRRETNQGRKVGNIADFCERWGADYDFMVVLDADSLMTGSTLVALVRRMETTPDAGVIQTVPIPARQVTLFGRMLQFAAALQAPLLAAGQSFWQADAANYWGHNAILRVRPFMEHARLPVLPGRPPLGGEILSHDFVEAALLRRAGWKAYLHPSLDGSFEGLPGNIPDYATRDRRWAQGSLQHLRLLATTGLHPVSRSHFLFGALGYVSSLLWLLMLVAGTVYVIFPESGSEKLWTEGSLRISTWISLDGAAPISLLAITAVLLLLPKCLALWLTLARRRSSFGGAGRLLGGFVLEASFSVLVAPLMMMYHSRFVASILAGRNVPWDAQEREGRVVSWAAAWRSAGWITWVGIAWAGLTLYHSAAFFLWLVPIFLGLVASAPLIRFTSRPDWGGRARRHGLFLVPSETHPHSVLEESGTDRSWCVPDESSEEPRERLDLVDGQRAREIEVGLNVSIPPE